MKKKHIFVLALLVCAVLLITTAGSLAYYTDADTAHNVITSGNVKIRLEEFMKDENGKLVPFEGPINVMPGTTASKIVQVKNTGSGDAWVRIVMSSTMDPNFECMAEEGIEYDPGDAIDIHLKIAESYNIDRELWIKAEGHLCVIYYYKDKLAPGETTELFMESVTFPEEMGNQYKKTEFRINIRAEAVQAKNNGETVLEAEGWPEAGLNP